MGTQNKFNSVTIVSGADLSAAQYKAVTVAGIIAAASTTAIGILQDNPGASNRHAQVGYQGIMLAHAAAAITAGGALTVTTSGYITLIASGGGTSCGKALEAANSGDLFTGLYDFSNATTVL